MKSKKNKPEAKGDNEYCTNPKEVKFEVKEANYDALVKGYLDLKENLLNLHKEFNLFKLQTKLKLEATEFKGKYFIYVDTENDKTHIREQGVEYSCEYDGILTNQEVLNLYLNDKD